MSIKIARPTDDYSPDWAAYWEQNPHMLRSVGSDVVDPPKEPPADPADPPKEPDLSKYVPKEEYAKMQEELDRMKAKHQEAEKHRKAQEEAARKAAEEAAKKSGDVEALEKSWTEKFQSAVSEKDSELTKLQEMVYELTVGSAATSLAAKIAMDGCADGLKPHIQSRLKTEIVDGSPVVKVLGRDGKPSAMSLEDLEKELKGTPYLAPLIKGSSASGGGGLNGKGTAGKGEISREDFDKLPAHEKPKVAREKRIV